MSTVVPQTAHRQPTITIGRRHLGAPGLDIETLRAQEGRSDAPRPDGWGARRSRGDAGVELGDHLVPHAEVAAQAAPEVLAPALLEQVERRALLLDPGVVAEVEDP